MERTGKIGTAVAIAVLGLALALYLASRPERRAQRTSSSIAHSVAVVQGADGAPREPATPPRGTTEGTARDDDAFDAATRRHLQALAQGGDARQRLIALRLLAITDPGLRRRAREIAASLRADAPDDELIAMAQTWFCDEPDCTPAERDASRAVAPDNLAAHAEGARAAGSDDGALNAVLADAARTARYDSQYQTLALETIAAFDGLPLPPITPVEREMLRSFGRAPTDANRREARLWGYIAAVPLPALQAYTRPCTPPVSTARARDCQAIFRLMATATTVVERSIALSMLEKLTRSTSGHAYWADAQRDLRWQLHRFASVQTDSLYLAEFMRYGEAIAVQRALQRAGIPLRAPPGWTPR